MQYSEEEAWHMATEWKTEGALVHIVLALVSQQALSSTSWVWLLFVLRRSAADAATSARSNTERMLPHIVKSWNPKRRCPERFLIRLPRFRMP